jgi:uncharacterized repeat protein (TIGR01451 family)
MRSTTTHFAKFAHTLVTLQASFGPLTLAASQPARESVLAAAGSPEAAPGTAAAGIVSDFGRLPLRFELNRGQAEPRTRFLAHARGYTLDMAPGEAALHLGMPAAQAEARSGLRPESGEKRVEPPAPVRATVRMRLDGADPTVEPEGLDPLPGVSHYYIGDDPRQWVTSVPAYGQVRYPQVYAGVDLVYYGRGGDLEYDFVLAPGADPNAINVRFEGADRVEVDEAGALVLETPAGALRQEAPLVYQEGERGRQTVASRYVARADGAVGFEVDAHDPAIPLVIDPVIVYIVSSQNPDERYDPVGLCLDVDSSGNAYVATSILAPPGLDGYLVGVFKLDPTGSDIVYAVNVSGRASATLVKGLAVDDAGNAYVTGETSATDFPLLNPFQTDPDRDGDDAFVAKLDANGLLAYSTYLGGSELDMALDVAVDDAGSAYVVGWTKSPDFPTREALFPTLRGEDGFVTKLDPSGSALAYSTYLGGSSREMAHSVVVDDEGCAYVAGTTSSDNFPTWNAFQSDRAGSEDLFVVKLDAGASTLEYSTYLGGSGLEYLGWWFGDGLAVDEYGNAYVTGTTESADFPTLNAFQPTLRGLDDAFVTKLDARGAALRYSTYLGGSASEEGHDVAVDRMGCAYVTGLTMSDDFPTRNPIQAGLVDDEDPFVTKLSENGASPLFSSYVPGGDPDLPDASRGLAVAVDSAFNVYVAGEADDEENSPRLIFVTKIGLAADLSIQLRSPSVLNRSNSRLEYRIQVANRGPAEAADVRVFSLAPEGTRFVSASTTQGSLSTPDAGASGKVICDVGTMAPNAFVTIRITVDVTAPRSTTVRNTASVRGASPDPNTDNNSARFSVVAP